MNDNDEKLLDHEYDGIRELDNDLPRWWVWMFYITIIWAVGYYLYYHTLGIGYTSHEMYQSEIDPGWVRESGEAPKYFGILPEYRSPLAATEAEKAALLRASGVRRLVPMNRESDTTTYVLSMDDATISAGKSIYQVRCASCHGPAGQGGVGPNLTDNYWLHGAEPSDLVKTVRYGVPTKGMISWLGTLKQEEILQVVSYVTTLHGTNPPNPKAPEGELYSQ